MFRHFIFTIIVCCNFNSVLFASDMILTNGKIYTVNDDQPWAEAVVILDGVIELVGTNEQANDFLNAEIQLIDLEGKLVLPGFHDVHMHPLEAYESPQSVCILSGGETISGHISRLKNCLDEQKEDDWFLGWGYWIDEIFDLQTMPKLFLDDLVSDKPAVIFSLDSHSNWVNSAALEKMGWDKNTPNPTAGIIIKDEHSGEPTGIVFDNAAEMINELIFEPTDQKLNDTYYGLLEAMQEISSYGITSIADAKVYWTQKHHEVWQRAANEGTLQARTVLHLWAYPHIDDSQIETIKSLYQNDQDSLLRITGVKAYSDGLIGNTTAAMKLPYDVDFGIIKDNRGLNYFGEKRLTKFITELEPVGFDFMIHTIGDRAVHESLNSIESSIKANGVGIDRRHRLTHLDLIDEEDLPRFNELEVIADFQLASDWSHPDEYNAYTSIFVKDRVDFAYRIKSIFDSGALVTLSSDFDVSSMNPLLGIQNSITRGDQSLPSLEAAIKAYTLSGAYALKQESITGSIEKGKFADLIVLDENLFDVSQSQISSAKVLWTLLAGEEMFRDSSW